MSFKKGFKFRFNSLKNKTLFAALSILAFTSFVLIGSYTPAEAAANPKYASIVMDSDTGMILHQRYADKKLHPASITKVMTLLLVFDALEQGNVRMNDRIRVSHRAASMQPSKLGLKPGSSIKLQDAISALVTKSANDVAVAIAEHLAGSEKNFATAMTRRAHSIGMSRTHFRNASGLHHPRQISTARDVAKMARYVINRYPEYYKYFNRKSFTYQGKTYKNHNKLLGKYAGMDGMKTGYIQASGFNLVASAVRDNQRVIGVVFGGRTGKTRNAHMRVLLDQGFAKAYNIRVASIKAPVPDRKPQMILAAYSPPSAIEPAAGSDNIQMAHAQSAPYSPEFKGNIIRRMMGEGDYDEEAVQRFEAGMYAISAVKGQSAHVTKASYFPDQATVAKPVKQKPWAIQIGAFHSEDQSHRALDASRRQLPAVYANAAPVIAPLKTHNGGWLFRARLSGYSRAQAFAACQHLQECMPVAP